MKTGNVRDLCAARRTFDASLAVDGQPTAQREKFEAERDDLVAHERKQHARCRSAAKRRIQKPDPPLIAHQPKPASPEASSGSEPSQAAIPGEPNDSNATKPLPVDGMRVVELRPPDAANPVLPMQEPPSDDALMPVNAGRVRLMPRVDGPRPGRGDDLRPDRGGDPRPGRGLVIAGGVTLGVAVALMAGAGVTGRRMADTRQTIVALGDGVDGHVTTGQDAVEDALRQDYWAVKHQTTALALGAGATALVAVVLASVGGRRMARAASRTALVPFLGGLALHARF